MALQLGEETGAISEREDSSSIQALVSNEIMGSHLPRWTRWVGDTAEDYATSLGTNDIRDLNAKLLWNRTYYGSLKGGRKYISDLGHGAVAHLLVVQFIYTHTDGFKSCLAGPEASSVVKVATDIADVFQANRVLLKPFVRALRNDERFRRAVEQLLTNEKLR